jgi:PPOX class probable F420-dependent enzyme
VSFDPARLPDAATRFLTDRHLASLSTLRPDGSQHVVPVGFSWDAEHRLARVITSGTSRKAAHAALEGARAALCQVDGRFWLTLEGLVQVLTDADSVADAEARYTARYRPPRENPQRVVLQIAVDRILGSVPAEQAPAPVDYVPVDQEPADQEPADQEPADQVGG